MKDKTFFVKLNGVEKKKFYLAFRRFIAELAENVVEPLEINYVINVFKSQGYYATDKYRVGYDIKNKKFYATPRMFGK